MDSMLQRSFVVQYREANIGEIPYHFFIARLKAEVDFPPELVFSNESIRQGRSLMSFVNVEQFEALEQLGQMEL